MTDFNIVKFHLHNIFLNLLVLFINGAIFQTFLLECGMSEHSVNVYCSVMQIIQMTVMLVFSGKIDKINNVIRTSGVLCLPALLLTIILIVMSFDSDAFGSGTLIFLYGSGMFFTIFYSIIQILDFKLPYCIMDMSKYGVVMARTGFFMGISSAIMSIFMSTAVQKGEYFQVMQWIYCLSVVIIIAYMFSTLKMKMTDIKRPKKISRNDKKINLFRYKPFYVLIVPNLFRGFCLGILNLIITIGYYTGRLNTNSASVSIILTNVLLMTGCFLYPFISKRIKEGKMILISSIGVFATLSMMFIHQSTVWFLVTYSIAYFFIVIINYAVPVEVTQIVDYDVMGHYSAWRLLLNAIGVAFAGFVCIFTIDTFSPVGAMVLTGGLQLFSGIVYYKCSKTMVKQQ